MYLRNTLLLAVSALIASCSQEGADSQSSATLGIGSARQSSDPDRSGHLALVDPNHAGRADSLQLVDLAWGRLADVYAPCAGSDVPVLVARDLVIGESVEGLVVETEPLTGTTSVTILAPCESAEFTRAIAALESGLVSIEAKSLAADELPPWPLVPRNAALVARFDDLIDVASITPAALAIEVVSPPTAHAVRVLADSNHGGYADIDGDGNSEFHPTRVIVDLAVSALEARASASVLAPSPLGLPASESAGLANAALHLATEGDARLVNLTGGAVDAYTTVRAFRSGGPQDLHQGLMFDTGAPRVVGRQHLTLTAVVPDPNGQPGDYLVDLVFTTESCAQSAGPRDVIETDIATAVVSANSGAPVGGVLSAVHVRMLTAAPLIPGQAFFLSAYDPIVDQGREACFVQFLPQPLASPARGVSPAAQIIVRFNEPIDPATVDAFGGLELTRTTAPNSPDDYVAATVGASASLEEFLLSPLVPLDHVQGQDETYFVTISALITDLAGNPLAAPLDDVAFRLDPGSPTLSTGNYVLRFGSTDEDNNGFPEIRGQFLIDLAEGTIHPRPVTHFSAVADRTQPVPGVMFPFAPGAQTPLSSLGSKLHSLWRYCDVGFSLLDETLYNVDVEGLAWAPVGGAAVADHYDRFEISLAHGRFLPDEAIGTNLLPKYPDSGVVATYSENVLDTLQVVHPRELGYTVNPANLFVSSTGTTMMPYPLNQGIPASQFRYYTWRDTAIDAVGGPNGTGAELEIVTDVQGFGTPGVPYPAGQVPTIGLPLLMEFKSFPDAAALGLNTFDVSIAVNSSSRPNFRAFSTGGMNTSGQVVIKDPDLETVADGGFNPSSLPPGAATMPVDNTFYIGQMDLVLRVSRVHGVWIDTQSANAMYAGPVVDPAPADQPLGTSVTLAWRGASAVTAPLLQNAGVIDAYGNPISPSDSVTFPGGDSAWKTSIAQIDGRRYAQARITLISNAATGDRPELSGLAIAYER